METCEMLEKKHEARKLIRLALVYLEYTDDMHFAVDNLEEAAEILRNVDEESRRV